MAENFDSGSLTWVKDQIDQLLNSVLANVNTVQANLDDTSPMRLSQTSLYQATGALDRFAAGLRAARGGLFACRRAQRAASQRPHPFDGLAGTDRCLFLHADLEALLS